MRLWEFTDCVGQIFPRVNAATQRAIVGWLERSKCCRTCPRICLKLLRGLATVYRACELCADGQTESTAAFISRFFQLCLRAVCSPAATPETPSNPGHGNTTRTTSNIQALQNAQVSDSVLGSQSIATDTSMPSNKLLDSMHTPLIGSHDASYWCVYVVCHFRQAPLTFASSSRRESIFPGLSTDWSWLDQSLEEGLRPS